MTYITLDFGSSNSGAVLNTQGKEYSPNDLLFIHRQDETGILKQPTVFWIKRSLLEKNVVNDSDINIFSCVYYEPDNMSTANFVWCRDQIRKMLPTIINNQEEWVRIKHPKMELYKLGETISDNSTIKGNDNRDYSLKRILHLFFSVIKKECMRKVQGVVGIATTGETMWNITLPGLAIWNQEVVNFIRDIAKPIFGDNVAFYSEAECALLGINLSLGSGIDFEENRHSLVVDLGGGTADICIMRESLNEDGTNTFDEQKTTKGDKDSTSSICAGGNDIDRGFISFFCDYLADGIDLEDTSVVCIYNAFAFENPAGAMIFDSQWKDLQKSDQINEKTINFNPGRPFREWVKIHYQDAAKKMYDGEFPLDGDSLRKNVFMPIYEKICHSIEEHVDVAKKKGINLKVLYFAGGLSLDKNLRSKITDVVRKRFPNITVRETSGVAAIGAVQRGGNHISVNKEKLIRRMARRTFYVEFGLKINGDINTARKILTEKIRDEYADQVNISLTDVEINKMLDEQWHDMEIRNGLIIYLSPLCVRFAPVFKQVSLTITPTNPGKQKGADVRVFSSSSGLKIFKNSEVKDEGQFTYDFGYCWEQAKLVFDPTASNAVEGIASFYLTDNDSNKKLKGFIIHNVSKRGF
jgi:hypothetical protein